MRIIWIVSVCLGLENAQAHDFLTNDPAIIEESIRRAREELPCQSTGFLCNMDTPTPPHSGSAVLLNPTTALTAHHVVEKWQLKSETAKLCVDSDFLACPDLDLSANIETIIAHTTRNWRKLLPCEHQHYQLGQLGGSFTDEEILRSRIRRVREEIFVQQGPDLAILKLRSPINLPSHAFLPLLPKAIDPRNVSGVRVFNPCFGMIHLNNGRLFQVRPSHKVAIRHLGITNLTYTSSLNLFYERYEAPEFGTDKYLRQESHHPLQTKAAYGSSGSSFITKKGGKYYIAAIQSEAVQRDGLSYSIAIPVYPYLDWIQSYLD